ncbi:hypothetical protein acdb102_21640 [Acidothermaceae bacterium B102]|nr:hypothetical protein acdb102_21640 [Acidothermaceae bacterium B102]
MGLCSIPGVSSICGVGTGIVSGAANDALSAMANSLGQGFSDMVTTITSFWTKLDVPTLAGGPIALLQSDLLWLQGFVVVASLLFAAAKIAITRNGKPAAQATGALMLTIVATSAGLVAIDMAAYSGDQFSTWIIAQSAGGDLGARLAAIAGLATLSSGMPGLVIVLAVLGIVSSLAQLGLLIARIGILGILAGTLPVTSAATNTRVGRAWFERVMGWLIAFVLYKPIAAVIYATAFYMIGDGTDITSVMSGLVLIIMAVLALPALLRLITPVVSGAMHGGSGAVALAAGGALATGAKLLADRAGQSPSGGGNTAQPGLVTSSSGGSGRSGPPGRPATAGDSGPAGSAAAVSPVAAGFQVAKAAHRAVKGAADHATQQGQ